MREYARRMEHGEHEDDIRLVFVHDAVGRSHKFAKSGLRALGNCAPHVREVAELETASYNRARTALATMSESLAM